MVRLFRRTVGMDTEEEEVEVMEVAVPLAEVDTADAVVTVAAAVEEIKAVVDIKEVIAVEEEVEEAAGEAVVGEMVVVEMVIGVALTLVVGT